MKKQNDPKVVQDETLKWFGPPWTSYLCVAQYQTDTPERPCSYCEERFDALDSGILLEWDIPIHLECFTHMTMGSAPHQRKECPCFGGYREDLQTTPIRKAAQAAVEEYRNRCS